jgi:predicted nucleic acid-binding protein
VKPVFVDTSGFFAVFVDDDPNHDHAVRLFARAERERWRLLTSWFVVFETHALLLNRARQAREARLTFLGRIEDDRYQVVRFRRRDIDMALEIVRSHHDKKYSLCDAHSFAAMERLRIRSAISLDNDFRSYGRFEIM